MPELIVGIDLHIAVGPAMVDRYAGCDLHSWLEVYFNAKLRLQLVHKLAGNIDTTSDKTLQCTISL